MAGSKNQKRMNKPPQGEALNERDTSGDQGKNLELPDKRKRTKRGAIREPIDWSKDIKGLYCQKMLEGVRFDKNLQKAIRRNPKKTKRLDETVMAPGMVSASSKGATARQLDPEKSQKMTAISTKNEIENRLCETRPDITER